MTGSDSNADGNRRMDICGHLRSGGVVGYHVCLTRTRSRVRSSSRVLPLFFAELTAIQKKNPRACASCVPPCVGSVLTAGLTWDEGNLKVVFEPRIELGTFSVLD